MAEQLDQWELNQLLLKSAQRGDSKGVKRALKGGADINYHQGYGSQEKTALHVSAQKGHHDIVMLLTTDYKAKINCRDKYGATPLNYSYLNDHHNVSKILQEAGASINYTRLMLDASSKGYIDKIIECLEKGININYSDKDHCTPLHISSSKGHHQLVTVLIERGADLEKKEHTEHRTPLHLASREGHYETVVVLVNNGANINAKDKRNNTPLHFACQSSAQLAANVNVISFLLSNDKIEPISRNTSEQTPLELISPYDKNRTIILQLFSTFESCRINFPIHSYSKVFLCGNTTAGKSSLTEVIKYRSNKSPDNDYDPQQVITNVTLLTAGIEPHTISSHEIGNIVLHDFAGHPEYYVSHAAVLEHLMLTSPGVFLILIKLTNDRNTFENELYFWTNYIENVSSRLSKQSHIIVIGSHIDEVSSTYDHRAISHLVKDVMESGIRKQNYKGYIAMECNRPGGKGVDQFIPLLASSCKEVIDRTDSISFYNHVLYSFLNDMKETVAITLDDLIVKLKEANHPSLPSDLPSVTHFLSILSDKGLILYLPSPSSSNSSWIIIDKTALLKEVNGVLFAPEAIERVHRRMASNTGIIPLCAIEKAFPKYDPIMIIGFMKSLELCHEIKASLLSAISTNIQPPLSSDASSENLLFFPSLISTESSTVMETSPSFGWCMWCPNSRQFFSSRFLKVLLLRLALQCLPVDLAGELEDINPAQKFQRCCSIWRNGIYWKHKKIEVIVEMSEYNRCLTVLVSGKDSKRALKVTAFVLKEIRSLQNDLCPCKVNEYIISPSQLTCGSANIRTIPVSGRCLITLPSVAKALLAGKDVIYDKNDRYEFEKEKVVSKLEPYLTLPPVIVKELHDERTVSLSSLYLDHIRAACSKILNKTQYLESNDIEVLRKRIHQFSIFTGLNPLVVSNLIESKLREITSKPLPDLTKTKDSSSDALPDLADLMDEVAAEAPDQWKNVGIQLRISLPRLNAIRTEQNNDCSGCFCAVFDEWKNTGSLPYTWDTIVKVLESKSVKRHDLANTIRKNYL